MYEINEDLVGLIQVKDTTAETIYKSLENSLVKMGKHFVEKNPALHCLAHRVSLRLQEVARIVTCFHNGTN